jgi:DNA-directed RNA polymerase sigma subunit (sigma70/sigma32)
MMRPYVIKLVREYDTLGDYTREQSDEIKQAAWVGVWVALAKFDPAKDVKFSTHAWYWARHEVQTYMNQNSRALPLTRHAWRQSKQLEAAWAEAHPGRPIHEASDEEIEALGLGIEFAREIIAAKSAPIEVDPEYDAQDDNAVENIVFDSLEDAALDAVTTIQGLLAEGDEDGAESVAWAFVSDQGLDDEIAANLLAAARL